jgi:hypothetical protein
MSGLRDELARQLTLSQEQVDAIAGSMAELSPTSAYKDFEGVLENCNDRDSLDSLHKSLSDRLSSLL